MSSFSTFLDEVNFILAKYLDLFYVYLSKLDF